MDVMADAVTPPSWLIILMSACTPEPLEPSLPVIVSIISFAFMLSLFSGAKKIKKAETKECFSVNDKRSVTLSKKSLSHCIHNLNHVLHRSRCLAGEGACLRPILLPHRQQEADDGHAGSYLYGEAADIAHSHNAALTCLAHVEQRNGGATLQKGI